MNFSYKWLKEYVEFDLSPEMLAKALTSCGLEVGSVEEVQAIRGGLKGLFVGQVVACEEHPNSDHLHVCQVDLGHDVPSQIVCGAPNVATGQKVIVADLGCVLYDGDKEFTIKRSKLRGVESNGMICAEDEIGVGTSHDGIMVLPDTATVGMPASEYFHLESDWVIEVDLTANRADAMSHWGIARDLYAWLLQNGYKTSLHRPEDKPFVADNNEIPIDVEVVETDACLRYACVSIKGCEVKESPKWLQEKLQTVGLRPINNIVDITNYMMLSYGQPMHCFDADMVEGNKIVVRTQPEGTPFVTLDGVEHKLNERDLSICNAREPMCIAGIFGGKGSGTYDTTRNVVLESACFHPTWIRKSARRHGLSTDASYRFERGVDPNDVVYVLKQAALMCKELAGGSISMDIKDVYPQPLQKAEVRLAYDYVEKLIGKNIGNDTIKSIATSLDMQIVAEDGQGITLLVPTYRVDVKRPCDVVEDILRIYGYNNVEIPDDMHSCLTVAGDEDRAHDMENIIGEQLVGSGFNEVMNNSLTKTAYYTGHNVYTEDATVKVMNPLSTDLGVMRQTLLFGGMENVMRNVNRKNANLRLFEFGNVYRYNESKKDSGSPVKAYEENRCLGLWITGNRVEGSWAHPKEKSSFYELKAYVEQILVRLGVSSNAIVCEKSTNDVFSAGLKMLGRNGKAYAEFGIVAKKTLKQFDLSSDVYYAELNWTALMKATKKNKTEYVELSKYPAVSRDLALLIDKGTEFAQIERIARQSEKKLLKQVELFDVYEGKNLPEGKKSYAVNFILEDEQKTLNDKQIDAVMNKIISALKQQLNAELR